MGNNSSSHNDQFSNPKHLFGRIRLSFRKPTLVRHNSCEQNNTSRVAETDLPRVLDVEENRIAAVVSNSHATEKLLTRELQSKRDEPTAPSQSRNNLKSSVFVPTEYAQPKDAIQTAFNSLPNNFRQHKEFPTNWSPLNVSQSMTGKFEHFDRITESSKCTKDRPQLIESSPSIKRDNRQAKIVGSNERSKTSIPSSHSTVTLKMDAQSMSSRYENTALDPNPVQAIHYSTTETGYYPGSNAHKSNQMSTFRSTVSRQGDHQRRYFITKESLKGNNNLDVNIHEKLELLGIMPDGSYYMRSCVTGSEGQLPAHILEPVDHLNDQPWYFEKVSRRDAEKMLVASQKHGTFLIRVSETTPKDYSLSILDGDVVKHYRVRNHASGGYFIELVQIFPTLKELVEFYSKHSNGLCSRLVIPCRKEIASSTHMIPDDWEIDRAKIKTDQVLGKGMFGVVMLGYLTLPDDKVALVAVKEIRSANCEAFLAEVNALKKLHHERLLRLLGVCTQELPYLLITEYMKTGSLLTYLKRDEGKYLSLEEMLHIALQVAEGMHYLECQKYVHRDLAARNVLLDDRLNSKIADFGLSMLVTDECGYSSNSFSESGHLPIKWTALEVLLGSNATSKSDVWSFGVLLTEIVTRGVTPYRDMDNSEVLEFLRAGQRMPQAEGMENRFYNITLSCWAKKPEDRPSFYELQIMLTEYIKEVKHRKRAHAFAVDGHG